MAKRNTEVELRGNKREDVERVKCNRKRRSMFEMTQTTIAELSSDDSQHSCTSGSNLTSILATSPRRTSQASSSTSSGTRRKRSLSMVVDRVNQAETKSKQKRKRSHQRALSLGGEATLSPHRSISSSCKSLTLSQDELGISLQSKSEIKGFLLSSEVVSEVSSSSMTQSSQIVEKAFGVFQKLSGSGVEEFKRFELALANARYACILCSNGADLSGSILQLHGKFAEKEVAVAFESAQKVARYIKGHLDSLEQLHADERVVFLVRGSVTASWNIFNVATGDELESICVQCLNSMHLSIAEELALHCLYMLKMTTIYPTELKHLCSIITRASPDSAIEEPFLKHLQDACLNVQSCVSGSNSPAQSGSLETNLVGMANTITDIIYGNDEVEVHALALCCFVLKNSSNEQTSAARKYLAGLIKKRLQDDVETNLRCFCHGCLQHL